MIQREKSGVWPDLGAVILLLLLPLLLFAGVVLMPVGLLGMLALVGGGGAYLPWVHEHPHVGGKAVWLTRGFWDARVLGALLISYVLDRRQVDAESVRKAIVEIERGFEPVRHTSEPAAMGSRV